MSPLASSTASNEASATPNPLPPGAPTALTATPGTAQIALTWTAPTNPGIPASPATRSSAAPPPEANPAPHLPPSPGPPTPTHHHPRRHLLLHRQSRQPDGLSPASNEATATPGALRPGAPTTLTAAPGTAQITLTWTAPTNPGNPALTGYQIFRGTTPGGESSTPLTTVTGTTYTDTTTTPGITYYYTVKAVSPMAISPASNEANATPGALAPGAPTTLTAVPGLPRSP